MEFFQELLHLQLLSIEKIFNEMNQSFGSSHREEVVNGMSKIRKVVFDLLNNFNEKVRIATLVIVKAVYVYYSIRDKVQIQSSS